MYACYIYRYRCQVSIADKRYTTQPSEVTSAILQRHQGLRPVGGASADCAEDGPVEGARHPWSLGRFFSRGIDVLGTCLERALNMGFWVIF